MKTNPLSEEISEPESLATISYRNTYISIAIVTLWLALFWQTTLSAINIWATSETFAHGFMILPIIVWLLWQDRTNFLELKAQTSFTGALLCIMFVLLWLLGQALEVTVFSQLGLFGGIAASHWMIFGTGFAKRYKFPLCYLIFAVPMGNTLIPLLQQITAEITVLMLNLSNIPVFFEGLYITIPTGRFEVAVACSGIRYLIASVAVGTLYAYLTYNKLYKQIIFFIISILVPILANGIRAYLIVLIAHLSDLKYATGVDHLIYGWLFFGVVILLMFFIGGFFADNKQEQTTDKPPSPKEKYDITPIVVVTIVTLAAVAVVRNIEPIVPPQQPVSLELPQLSGYTTEFNSNWGVKFNDNVAFFNGKFPSDVELFVAQYGNRQTQGELVTSTNWVYDKSFWSATAQTTGKLTTEQGDIDYIELQLVNSSGETRLVKYWYLINGRPEPNKIKVKFTQGLLALKNHQDPVFFIALSKKYEPGPNGYNQASASLNQWIINHQLSALLKGN